MNSGLAFFLLISFFAAAMANAHEQKIALTDILFNHRTGNLEIAHRISLHDAEHTLHKVSESKEDLTKSKKAREDFAKYVARRFELTLDDNKKLKLTLVGQEIERGYLWVYQETEIPEPASFSISNTILQDVVTGQVNTVNVRRDSKVATFEFKTKDGRKRYSGQFGPEKIKEEAKKK